MKRAALARVMVAVAIPGEEAFAIISTKPLPSGRRTLIGTARVRVTAAHGALVQAEVLAASGAILVGREIEVARRDLYLAADKVEHAEFGREVSRLWGHGVPLR